MTNMREQLHIQLNEIIPSSSRIHSLTRMVGHALIELGFLTCIECTYDNCIMPTRQFTIITPTTSAQDRGRAVIDHITELWEGGTDMPDNFQLIHFACNSRKTMTTRMKNPRYRELHSRQLRERWADPEYRERTVAKITASRNNDETRARASAAMKAHWADPEKRARHSASLARGERHRASRPDTACDICHKMFKGLSGVITHKIRAHRKS